MAPWRKKQKLNPRPKIPESHDDNMAAQIPDKFTKTADEADFSSSAHGQMTMKLTLVWYSIVTGGPRCFKLILHG